MKITDSDLNNIYNSFENRKTAYTNPDRIIGSYTAVDAQAGVMELLNSLNAKIKRQETILNQKKNISDSIRQNALTIATSGDPGLMIASIKDSIDRGSYSFVFSVSDLILNSKKIDDSTKFSIKRLKQKAEKLSGYESELDTLEQSKVIRKEMETYYENIGKVDFDELKNLSNMARSTAEIGYVRDKMKREKLD